MLYLTSQTGNKLNSSTLCLCVYRWNHTTSFLRSDFLFLFKCHWAKLKWVCLKFPPGTFKGRKKNPPKKIKPAQLGILTFSWFVSFCNITIFFKSSPSFFFKNTESKAVQNIVDCKRLCGCADLLFRFSFKHPRWVSYNTLVWLAYLAIDISLLQKSQTVKYYNSVSEGLKQPWMREPPTFTANFL